MKVVRHVSCISTHPFVITLVIYWPIGNYRRAGNFREVYILRSSRFDRIRESLSCKFVNITIHTHNTSTQIAKLKPRECLFERDIAKFYSASIFSSTVLGVANDLRFVLYVPEEAREGETLHK